MDPSSDISRRKQPKRGRPRQATTLSRVETSDRPQNNAHSEEPAIERRRTQVRLAQRAYRDRKESETSQLRKRVAELENTVQQINEEVERCVVTMAPMNVSPGMKVHIERIQRHCSCVIDAATNRSNSPNINRSRNSSGHGAVLDTSYDHQADQNSLAHETEPGDLSLATDQTAFGYTVYYYYETHDPHIDQWEDSATVSKPHISLQHRNVEDQRKIPPAMSSHRSSLAVRINRGCLIEALRLLMQPDQPLHKYKEVFGLAMQQGFGRMALIEHFRRYLDLGSEAEMLDARAGYLDTSASSFADERDYSLTRDSRHFQDTVDESVSRLGADNAFTDNEHRWLDAYDVQSYLAQCGITIDSSSRLVSVNIVSGLEATGQNSLTKSCRLTGSFGKLFDSDTSGHGSGIMPPSDISGSNVYDIDEVAYFNGRTLITTPHTIAPWQGASRTSMTGLNQTVQHMITDVTSTSTWESPTTQLPAQGQEHTAGNRARTATGKQNDTVTTLTFDITMLIKGKMIPKDFPQHPQSSWYWLRCISPLLMPRSQLSGNDSQDGTNYHYRYMQDCSMFRIQTWVQKTQHRCCYKSSTDLGDLGSFLVSLIAIALI